MPALLYLLGIGLLSYGVSKLVELYRDKIHLEEGFALISNQLMALNADYNVQLCALRDTELDRDFWKKRATELDNEPVTTELPLEEIPGAMKVKAARKAKSKKAPKAKTKAPKVKKMKVHKWSDIKHKAGISALDDGFNAGDGI